MIKRPLRTLPLLIAALALLAGCDRFTSVETRMARAASNLEAGEFQAALIDVRKTLDREPGNPDAQLLLVDVLKASGETQAARVQLDRAREAGAPPAATEPRQLELLLAQGGAEPARKALAETTALSPAQHATYEGRVLMLEQKPAEALAAFDRALAADASFAEATFSRIETLGALGQIDAARKAVDALLAQQPQSGRAWLFKGILAARTADFAAATEAFTKAIENSRGMSREQRVQAQVARLESQLAAGMLDAARSSLASLETAAGDIPIVSLMRARIALAEGKVEAAVNELRTFTQAVPQHMAGRLLLVAALQEQGSLEQAFAEAVRNVSEFPGRDEPRLALASVQMRMGRAADAEATLKPLVAQSPPNPLATSLLAELRVRGGEAGAGISLLEQSLQEHPQDARLKLQLAAAQLSAGNAARALQILDSVQDPSLSAARDRLHVLATAAAQGLSSVDQELDAAITRNPEDVDLLLMAAAYAANTGKIDQARERLQKALKIQPDNSILVQNLARLELSAGRVGEAEALAKSALEKTPNDAAAMVLMAVVAGQRGQDTEVDAWLNRARVANPGALDVSLALARRAMIRGNAAEARNILSETVRHAPTNPGARVALAELIASQGQSAEALTELREAARQHPDSALVPFSMAKVQLAAKDTAAARGSLRRALQLNPGWLPAASVLAGLEAQSGNLPAALEVVREVRRTNPHGNSADMLEGEIYLAVKRPAEAAKAFTAAYQLTPGSAAAVRVLMAKVQAKLNAPDAELKNWISRSPADSGARRALADYYLNTKSNDAAIEQLERVVAAQPADAIALNNLAWLYQQESDPRALATAEKAYAAAPKVAAVADTYGWILVQTGRTEDGAKVLAQAVQLVQDDPRIQFHLAQALAQTGQKQAAINLLKTLLSSSSQFESIGEARALLASLE